MEMAFEFFDSWLESQKDFLNNWIRSHRELMDNWLDSTRELRTSFGAVVGTQEGSQELLDLFNSWYTTMLMSSETFTEGIKNLQNVWMTTIDKQIEIGKEIAKLFFDLFPRDR
jgi:hypothetical protein